MSNYTNWISRINSDQKANSQKGIVLIDDIYGTEEVKLKLWDRRNKKEIEAMMKELGVSFKPLLSSTYVIENYSENVPRIINKFMGFDGESA